MLRLYSLIFGLLTLSAPLAVLSAQAPALHHQEQTKEQTVYATKTGRKYHRSLTSEQRNEAKALDDDLTKQCQANKDQCRFANAQLLLQAQVRLAEWGYGTKFTGEPDPDTVAAIRLYQQRNSLPSTGKLDGSTIVRMEADEKAVEAYPFTLPPFYFPDQWPSGVFLAEGVFRDIATGATSGPIQIWCDAEESLCLEEESTALTPAVSKMYVKEWTADHIVAEEVAACYTNQPRVERASKSVINTSFKTSDQGPCKIFEEKIIGKPLDGVYAEKLVDGVAAQIERSKARAVAVHRVKLFSQSARSLIDVDNGQKK